MKRYFDDMGADVTAEFYRLVAEAAQTLRSQPPEGCLKVTNLYVENGKLRVEYET